MVVLGWWLDSVVFEGFSNLNDFMILWFYDKGGVTVSLLENKELKYKDRGREYEVFSPVLEIMCKIWKPIWRTKQMQEELVFLKVLHIWSYPNNKSSSSFIQQNRRPLDMLKSRCELGPHATSLSTYAFEVFKISVAAVSESRSPVV